MKETKDDRPINEREASKSDVRAELKRNLAEEFASALALQEGLTDVQTSLDAFVSH
jgi:hypothetical protein